jgi:hypothetical protein
VLTLNYVDDARVWYPPGEGTRGEPAYDQGFDFWKRSTGIAVDGEERTLVELPSPTDPKGRQVLRLNVKRIPHRNTSDQPPAGRGTR